MTNVNRVDALRRVMKEHGCDGYLITDSDPHYTFYSLSREDRRINWITECQAQCGMAIVTANHGAAFQTPPNYHLLAKAETNTKDWCVVESLPGWLRDHSSVMTTLGYDPQLTPIFVLEQFQGLSCRLLPIESATNCIDAISANETSRSHSILSPIWSLDLRFAGQSSEEKIEKLRQDYLRHGDQTFTFVVTAMDEIAWLLNLRANDMECNPLFYSFMIISIDRMILFANNPHQDLPYDIRSYEDFLPFLSTLNDEHIWLDERTCVAVLKALPSPPARISRSPIQQMKQIKNPVELNGFVQCHYRDCEAVCETFAWLEKSMDDPSTTLTEHDVVQYLRHRQAEKSFFIGISFDTISATGSNTALMEYAPPSTTGGRILDRDLYYLDAGANYLDGTTDMTRTFHFGQPTSEQIQCYTAILRGILAVEMTAFPSDGTVTGHRVDALLEQYFNALHYSSLHVSFGHGVSHGQGVIEGGVAISDVAASAGRVALQPGMVLTLEPGIYLEGRWGIRIENVYAIEEDGAGWMRFVPLTLLPYCPKLIDIDQLSKQEILWIEKYYQRCLDHVQGGPWMKKQIDIFLLSAQRV